MAKTTPALMVKATKASPAPARPEPSRKKANSFHGRAVKGSCSTVFASAFTRSFCSSVMAMESSRPPIRTRTLLSSLGSGVMRLVG